MEKYFTVEELSKYLSFAEKTIYKWVLNEEIPFIKINQTLRFRLSDIEKWLEKNKRGASSISSNAANVDLFQAGGAADSLAGNVSAAAVNAGADPDGGLNETAGG